MTRDLTLADNEIRDSGMNNLKVTIGVLDLAGRMDMLSEIRSKEMQG